MAQVLSNKMKAFVIEFAGNDDRIKYFKLVLIDKRNLLTVEDG